MKERESKRNGRDGRVVSPDLAAELAHEVLLHGPVVAHTKRDGRAALLGRHAAADADTPLAFNTMAVVACRVRQGQRRGGKEGRTVDGGGGAANHHGVGAHGALHVADFAAKIRNGEQRRASACR